MSTGDKFELAFQIGSGLLSLAREVFRAITSQDVEKVDDILDSELMISVARYQAEREADGKFK